MRLRSIRSRRNEPVVRRFSSLLVDGGPPSAASVEKVDA